MRDDMCQPRSEIVANDPKIQQALDELKKLRSKEGNGHTRREILEYELLIESRIEGVQTQQDVSSIKSSVEKLVDRLDEQAKYPTIIYQLMRMPLMGWTMLLATGLGVWLISNLGSDTLIKWLNAADIPATSGDVNAVVTLVMGGLIVTAARRYVKYVEECEDGSN
jgi:hypothetical protein